MSLYFSWSIRFLIRLLNRKRLKAAEDLWLVLTPSSIANRDYTASKETERWHALEVEQKDMLIVHQLERQLNITSRWTRDDVEWKDTEILVGKRRYQQCLDTLEGLIVARMFELMKMNMSQTGMWFLLLSIDSDCLTRSKGYKMRKHIGNALKSRSQAIRSALDKYNAAACKLNPLRAELSWDAVVEYVFLADFDLLSDTREDIRTRCWATPAARQLMDQYFKMERAREEIARLNVEVARLATFIRDEEEFLLACETALSVSDPSLAHQLHSSRLKLGQFNDIHVSRLLKLAKLPSFTGSIAPGTCAEATLIPAMPRGAESILRTPPHTEYGNEEEEEGEEQDEDRDRAVDAAVAVLGVVTTLL